MPATAIDGCSIAYEVLGSGVPVVLTPGSRNPMSAIRPIAEVLAEHFYYTYITDHYAIRNRRAVGVDRLMWSSDFPHTGSDWPDSWRTIDTEFADMPREEKELILSGNAMRLYKFDR